MGTLLTELSSVLFPLLSFSSFSPVYTVGSLGFSLPSIPLAEEISFPFFELMNSRDLVSLLAVYNKSTTEQTSMIKSD